MKRFCFCKTELLKIIKIKRFDKEKQYHGLLILFVQISGLWSFFPKTVAFSQNISFAFMLYFPEENDAIRKEKLFLLEFYSNKITIQILCSCKSNPFISMA